VDDWIKELVELDASPGGEPSESLEELSGSENLGDLQELKSSLDALESAISEAYSSRETLQFLDEAEYQDSFALIQ